MKVLLTDKQMADFRKKAVEVYPHLQVANNLYVAELIGVWEVSIDEKFKDLLPNKTIKSIKDIK